MGETREARRNPKQPSYLRRAGDFCSIKEAHLIAEQVYRATSWRYRLFHALLRWLGHHGHGQS